MHEDADYSLVPGSMEAAFALIKGGRTLEGSLENNHGTTRKKRQVHPAGRSLRNARDDVAKVAESWQGKVVVDSTNAYGGQPSSAVIAQVLLGAGLVKAFNHLPAHVLAEDPEAEGGRRVLFLSGDDEGAVARVAALVERFGFAPVELRRLAEGGLLVQARGDAWEPLIFEDLFKKAK